MLTARSKARFPTLAEPACPWHDDCTPMDCENFRTLRNVPPLVLSDEVQSVNNPSERGKQHEDRAE